MKVEQCPAYIIHTRPFKDSSLLLECLSAHHGLVSLIAKGAKRPRSRWQGILQPFIALSLNWVGRSELKTLTSVETTTTYTQLRGQKILVGLYLNELLMRLLQHLDPHPQLFLDYDHTITALVNATDDMAQQGVLRQFEIKLLAQLGYGLDLTKDVQTGESIAPDLLYGYEPAIGIVDVSHRVQSAQQIAVSGATILALAAGIFTDDHQLREAKKLMRFILSYYLGDKALQSRKLFSLRRDE